LYQVSFFQPETENQLGFTFAPRSGFTERTGLVASGNQNLGLKEPHRSTTYDDLDNGCLPDGMGSRAGGYQDRFRLLPPRNADEISQLPGVVRGPDGHQHLLQGNLQSKPPFKDRQYHYNDVFERTGWDTQTTQSNNQSHFLDPQTAQLQTHSAPPTGEDNNLADSLSRLNPMTEWQLNPAAFKVIDNKWGPHSVDRFASHHNHLLPRYNSRFHDPKAEATDALLQDWTKETNWINPPFRIIPLVVQKLINSPAKATLIVPYWPSAPWFTDLMKISEDTIPMSTNLVLPAHASAEPWKNREPVHFVKNGHFLQSGLVQ